MPDVITASNSAPVSVEYVTVNLLRAILRELNRQTTLLTILADNYPEEDDDLEMNQEV